MTVVEDAARDARFRDNPLVIGEVGIRFYAGFPIRLSEDRLPIGTLCVIDQRPRTLSADKMAALAALGQLLEGFIATRMRLAKLETAAAPTATVVRRG